MLLASIGVAYLSKVTCAGEAGTNLATRDWCYTDLRSLYEARGFDRDAVPYDTRFVVREPGDASVLEYPPGTGFGAWAVALATDTAGEFIDLNALTLAIAAFITLWQLDVALRRVGRPPTRLLRFAASPTLMVLGMQNWDLWSLAPVAAGLAAAAGRRPRVAAAWFGLAAGFKWWPAILVVPLLVGPWADRRRPWMPGVIAAAVWWLVQLPALLVDASGWWASIAFHLEREPNRASPIGVIANVGDALVPSPFWDGSFVTVTTALTFLTLIAGSLYVGSRLRRSTIEPAEATFALVCLFLVTSKVVSVQFLLWLLPLAALARIAYAPFLAADVLNVAVWWIWSPVGDDPVPAFWVSLAVAFGRTLLLVGVLAHVMRHREPSHRGEPEVVAAEAAA